MSRRYYRLPSLTSIGTFETCARHGSFTAAAGELGVTLGAVSRQIKLLEEELGCPLFMRRYRGVELTDEGQELFHLVSNSFQQIGSLCEQLRSRVNQTEVTIAANAAFSMLWLMPRLSDFWRRYPGINVSHVISDNASDPAFLRADLRIRYGSGDWYRESSEVLFGDSIYPVCGNSFAVNHDIKTVEDLLQLPLIRLDDVDPNWTGWKRWFGHWNIEASQLNYRRFNNYVVALQAAEENQGVLLGWDKLVAPLVKQNRLVRLLDFSMAAPDRYYLTWDSNRELSEAAGTLRDWLASQSGED